VIGRAAERVVVQKPAAGGEYVASLTVADAAGRTDTGSARFTVAGGLVRVPDPMTTPALWIERATVYGVVPGTFGEPGFAAVTARLDDLRDLGIAALWLSPITRTPPGDFGYAVTDYFDTRQDYGTKEEFRVLVQAAHARGIRVLIDVVPNHTSIRHPYFTDLETHGSASPYVDFYDRDERGETTFYFHYKQLRNLDFDNPEVRAFVIEALSFWVREYDVDGFRVDVAWGIRDRRPDFWAACNAELKRLKPDALLIAEASARDPFYVANGFDAAYDWTDKLGRWAWSDFLEDGAPMAEGVTAAVRHTGADGEEHPLVFRFLNNNDTGPRFITTHGVDRYRVASAMLLTLPGLPCVYNGDEVGAEFLPYEDDAVDWTDRHGLRAHFRHLITLRAEVSSLHSRRWRPLPVEPARPLFGYLRFGSPDDQPCLVLLNFSGDDLEATLPLPADFAALERPGELFDLYARQPVRIATDGDHRTIPMPPWRIRILVADLGGEPASAARAP
jgi:glycosidase